MSSSYVFILSLFFNFGWVILTQISQFDIDSFGQYMVNFLEEKNLSTNAINKRFGESVGSYIPKIKKVVFDSFPKIFMASRIFSRI